MTHVLSLSWLCPIHTLCLILFTLCHNVVAQVTTVASGLRLCPSELFRCKDPAWVRYFSMWSIGGTDTLEWSVTSVDQFYHTVCATREKWQQVNSFQSATPPPLLWRREKSTSHCSWTNSRTREAIGCINVAFYTLLHVMGFFLISI